MTAKKPLKLIVGAGNISYSGWISTNIASLNICDDASWAKLFEPDSIDAILAEHVWEHLCPDEAILAAKNCYNYLKKRGGYLRIAVPDGYNPSKEYIARVDLGNDGHKVLYNYKNLALLFSEAGFKVDLLEYYDQEGTFHYKKWSEDGGLIRRSLYFDRRNSDCEVVLHITDYGLLRT